jgi:hypothetical protein
MIGWADACAFMVFETNYYYSKLAKKGDREMSPNKAGAPSNPPQQRELGSNRQIVNISLSL